jgi:hypothetical protein
MDGNEQGDYGDDQGTRVGAPDGQRHTPARHSDTPPDRPERQTGAGAEATMGARELEDHDREHRSGYGGAGGSPVTSSDKRDDGKKV